MAIKRRAKIFENSAIPLFLGLALVGLLVGFRWFSNPPVIGTDGIVVVVIGFLYLLKVKFSRLRRGVGKPLDPTETTDIEQGGYTAGFVILAIGIFLVLLGNSAIVNPSP